jgi:hypothetical protein
MDRICPFLALAADHRTVVDGYDPDHLCHALPPDALDRSRQVQLCLSEAHRDCERYLAALEARRGDGPILPAPAPDARIARTRLVLDAEAPVRPLTARQRVMGARSRRLALAGVVAILGILALASGAAEAFANLVAGPGATPSPTALPTAEATPSTTETVTPATEPPPSATPVPPTPAATPVPTPLPVATPRSYVVQEGDTLSSIAASFGTTVAAIQSANGLGGSDIIEIGQVLVIP